MYILIFFLGKATKMCRTVHNILSSVICMIQMFVRVVMTIFLMLENLIRMFLQTIYNTISFILQIISLLPICLVILLTARMKCFMCGGGGGCPTRSSGGGGCDCLMSLVALTILFLIFRATGVLDKIFYRLGYAKAAQMRSTGPVTQCSRNDTEYYDDDELEDQKKATTKNARRFRMRPQTEDQKALDNYEEITEDLYSDLDTADPITISIDPSDLETDISDETFDNGDNVSSIVTSARPTSPLTVSKKVTQKQGKDLSEVIYFEFSDVSHTTTKGPTRTKFKPDNSSKIGITNGEMTTVLYYLVA